MATDLPSRIENRLSWYYGVLPNQKAAKYLLCKSIGVEMVLEFLGVRSTW